MAEELPKPMTQAEFDALPTGAQFIFLIYGLT